MSARSMAVDAYADVDVLSLDDAREHLTSTALLPGRVGTVGLELEAHLVDLDVPSRRVGWDRLGTTLAAVPVLPRASRITVEPGGQIELSTPPQAGVAAAVQALQADEEALRASLSSHGLGLAPLGTDLSRAARRVNDGNRYAAMEAHWDAVECGPAGRSMMCSTASLQLNVEAGPVAGWSARVGLIHALGPVLVAMSTCSPYLAGVSSGWASMRQQVWGDLDQRRCGPVLDGELPADEWADYALHAPVMLVRGAGDDAIPVRSRVSFATWVSGRVRLGERRPNRTDLDYHLTTLFPPVRPRGWLEVRCLDAVPRAWWPGLVAIAVTLIDDPRAADAAAAACAPTRGRWEQAARDGLADPVIGPAVAQCVEAAVSRCPVELRADAEAYAELLASGRTPGDAIRESAERDGPVAAMVETASA